MSPAPDDFPLRECTECWEKKPKTQFYKKADGRDGLTTQCGTCLKKKQKRKYSLYTERQFTKDVIQIAHECGCYAAHFKAAIMPSGRWATPVQADGKGFPDLLIVKEPYDLPRLNMRIIEAKKAFRAGELAFKRPEPCMGHVWAAELKLDGGDLRDDQIKWLLAFNEAGIPAYVWTPEDKDEIRRILEAK